MNEVEFQTPENVCRYMSSFLPDNAGTILEPTSGLGNLVNELKHKGNVIAPKEFFAIKKQRFDWVVMNPPFTPMALGYKILFECMEMSDNIIALMPWLTIINSQKRTNDIIKFGLVSITHLPRSIFKGARVQTCILQMSKGYNGKIEFINYCI
jgi:type I restriction-modification system DNA methylase subunit